MFSEAATKLDHFASLPLEEQDEISLGELRKILISKEIIRTESGAERVKPISTMLQWIQKEVFSIILDSEEKVDKILEPQEVKRQLEFLQTRLESLSSLIKVVRNYKEVLNELKKEFARTKGGTTPEVKQKLVALVRKYIDTFIKELRTYLDTEAKKTYRNKSAAPFPLAITRLPLSLLSLSSEHLELFDLYIHDLNTQLAISQTRFFMILGSENGDLEAVKPEAADAFELETIDEIHTALMQMLEYHDQYDFKAMQPIMVPRSLGDFTGLLSREFPLDATKKISPYHQDNQKFPVKYKFNISNGLPPEFTNLETRKPDFALFESKFSRAFGLGLFFNIKQNIVRVNNDLKELGQSNLITEVLATLSYELLDPSKHPLQPGQYSQDNKGMWITLTVKDNGPGFAPEENDAIEVIDGTRVRIYTPKRGQSGHKGEGIALATIKKTIEKAGGICSMYTSLDEGGAVTKISFPLFKKNNEDIPPS